MSKRVHTDNETGAIHAPILNGTNLMGVLTVTPPTRDSGIVERALFIAQLLGNVGGFIRQREIQDRLRDAKAFYEEELPTEFPEVPGLSGAAVLNPFPGKEVGGDFYDWFPLEGGRFACYVGDVMSHGQKPSLYAGQYTNITRAILRGDTGQSAGAAAERINRAFYDAPATEESRFERMVTEMLVIVDPEEKSVDIAGIGHHSPFILCGDSVETIDIKGMGLPAQIKRNQPIATRTISVEKHCKAHGGKTLRVVLFTDGYFEGLNRDGTMNQLGMKGLQEIVAKHAGKTPQEMVRSIDEDVRSACIVEDDATVVVLEIDPDVL